MWGDKPKEEAKTNCYINALYPSKNSPKVYGSLLWKYIDPATDLSRCSLIQVHLLSLTKIVPANRFNTGVKTSNIES
jgi:hypothetical protein